MGESPVLVLTAEKIAERRAEKDGLEREIAAKQKQLAALNEWLRAAEFLIGDTQRTDMFGEPTEDGRAHHRVGDLSMIDAIDKIANESPAPISKAELRERLTAMGFPPSSLSNYFYTVIMRLKQKQRITVHDDGRLWKAQTP